jgi:hypothetical protein
VTLEHICLSSCLLNNKYISLRPAGAAYSYCLTWRGLYRPNNSKPVSVTPGQVYGMRVVLEAPVAAADREAGLQPRLMPVSILESVELWFINVMC